VFDVDVGAAHAAALPILAFERVTKKNRPRLERGDVVYARVAVASKHLAPELMCVSKRNRADGFGVLTGGLVLSCSLAHAAHLLRKECFVLHRLGREFPFEIAVGHNGRFWINAVTPARTLLVAQALINAEFLSDAQVDTMVTVLVQQARASGPL
jgi:exosome complex component RRP40